MLRLKDCGDREAVLYVCVIWPQSSAGKWSAVFDENGLHKLPCLNVWSLISKTLWGGQEVWSQ